MEAPVLESNLRREECLTSNHRAVACRDTLRAGLPWLLLLCAVVFGGMSYQRQVDTEVLLRETAEKHERLVLSLETGARENRNDQELTKQNPIDVNLIELPNGLYRLEAPIVVSNLNGVIRTGKNYTIHHIKTEIDIDGYQHPLQVGIGFAGLLSAPQFYVDYDGDGIVDQALLHEIVTWLPFQKLFSRTVDPYRSQNLYGTFLIHWREAKFTEHEQISEHGSKLVRNVEEIIREHSDELSRFIKGAGERLPVDENRVS